MDDKDGIERNELRRYDRVNRRDIEYVDRVSCLEKRERIDCGSLPGGLYVFRPSS